MKRYVLLIAVALIGAIGITMFTMGGLETAAMEPEANHCAPDGMELLASDDAFLCVDPKGNAYMLARK